MTSAAAVLVLATAARAKPPAPKAQAPDAKAETTAPVAAKDVVKLKSGGLLRGTIAELVPGEFVVIVLITGETRRIAAAEFDYAGPEDELESNEDGEGTESAEEEEEEEGEDEPDERQKRRKPSRTVGQSMDELSVDGAVSVTSTGEPVIVFVRVPGDGAGKRFEELCKTPCDTYLAPGEYEMALAPLDSEEPVEARERVRIAGSASLEATYESRASVRAGGAVLMILGLASGIAVVATADTACSGTNCGDGTGQVMLGGLVIAGSLAAGIVMMTRSDIVEIDIVTGAPSAALPRRALAMTADPLTASPALLPGMSLRARF